MKINHLLTIALVSATLGLPSAFAQSKKELKEEVVRLTGELTTSKRENDALDTRNKELQQENQKATTKLASLESENAALKEEVASKDKAYQLLNSNYSALQTQSAATAATGGGSGKGGSAAAGASGKTPKELAKVDPNDTRKCARNQGKLLPGFSYTEDFARLNSRGYGLQVYSYYNLCQATEKADEFKKQYTMYKTYIHVKEVDGVMTYAVVYGSLKDYETAKNYGENFRKIAKNPIEQGAFVVQHTAK